MKKLFIILFIALFAVGCSSAENKSTDNGNNLSSISSIQLSENNGKSGNKCFVAISGKVYEIKESNKWIDGNHLESEGKASCGKDLTEVMNDSPHGISILTTSPKVTLVGQLSN
jgi:predicted heme/steroid binding protein